MLMMKVCALLFRTTEPSMHLCNWSLKKKNLLHRILYGIITHLLNHVSIVICTAAFTIFMIRELSRHRVG